MHTHAHTHACTHTQFQDSAGEVYINFFLKKALQERRFGLIVVEDQQCFGVPQVRALALLTYLTQLSKSATQMQDPLKPSVSFPE